MIEKDIQNKKLDHQDGFNFAQWSITMVTTGEDCPYDKWRKPPVPQFELLKLKPNELIGITSGEIIEVKES